MVQYIGAKRIADLDQRLSDVTTTVASNYKLLLDYDTYVKSHYATKQELQDLKKHCGCAQTPSMICAVKADIAEAAALPSVVQMTTRTAVLPAAASRTASAPSVTEVVALSQAPVPTRTTSTQQVATPTTPGQQQTGALSQSTTASRTTANSIADAVPRAMAPRQTAAPPHASVQTAAPSRAPGFRPAPISRDLTLSQAPASIPASTPAARQTAPGLQTVAEAQMHADPPATALPSLVASQRADVLPQTNARSHPAPQQESAPVLGLQSAASCTKSLPGMHLPATQAEPGRAGLSESRRVTSGLSPEVRCLLVGLCITTYCLR